MSIGITRYTILFFWENFWCFTTMQVAYYELLAFLFWITFVVSALKKLSKYLQE